MANPLSNYPKKYKWTMYLAYLLRLNISTNMLLTYKPTSHHLTYKPPNEKYKRFSRFAYLMKLRSYKNLRFKKKQKVRKFKTNKQLLLTFSKPPPKPLYMNIKKGAYINLGKFHYLLNFLIMATSMLTWLLSTMGVLNVINIIFLAILTPPFIISTIQAIRAYIAHCRIISHNNAVSLETHEEVRDGVPGAGKSTSLFYDSVIRANKVWETIQIQHFLIQPVKELIYKTGTDDQIKTMLEIEDAYIYYTTEHLIEIDGKKKWTKVFPCLWTNTPIFVDSFPTSKITVAHLLQEERLPYGAVLVEDEGSSTMPPELSYNKPLSMKEFFKYIRHFGDFYLGVTEQDASNLFIELRRCVGKNIYLYGQEWIIKPIFLLWILKRIRNHIFNKGYVTKFTLNLYQILDHYCRCIGVRKYTYKERGNLKNNNNQGELESRTKSFILPVMLNFEYDSRTFKNLYKAKNKALKSSIWTKEIVDEESLKEIFRADIQQMAMSKSQRKALEKQQRSK